MADGASSTPVRVPPSALDAEAAVLSACMLDETGAAFDQAAERVNHFSFYSDANSWIFRAITDLDAANQAVDVVTVARFLRDRGRLDQIGGTPYLAQLVDSTPAIAHVGDHAQIVADKSRHRHMIAQLQASLSQAHGEIEDVQRWSQDTAQLLDDIAANHPKDPPESLEQLVPQVIAEAESMAHHGILIAGVDTGWRDYTMALGGWADAKMHVVGARPGMGKTSFVLGAGLNVAEQDLGVVFVSCEMTKAELAQRALAVFSGVDTRKIQTGRMDAREWSAVMTAAMAVRKLPLTILYKPGARIMDVRSAIRCERNKFAKQGKRLGLVVVDYMQLLNGERQRGESRESEVARISQALTWMAGEFKVPLIAVSQLNRALESRSNKSKRPTMADLRESGAIENDAYSITLLYRDEYYDPGSEDAGILEAIIAKLRGGNPKTVRLGFVAECTRIQNLTQQAEFTGY